jgi:hypothetical protein
MRNSLALPMLTQEVLMKHGVEVPLKGILVAAVLLMQNSAAVSATNTDLQEFLNIIEKSASIEIPFLGCTKTEIKGTCVCQLSTSLDFGKAGCLVADAQESSVGSTVRVICAVPQFDSNGSEEFQRSCSVWAPLAK